MRQTQGSPARASDTGTDNEVESWGTMTGDDLKAWGMDSLYEAADAETDEERAHPGAPGADEAPATATEDHGAAASVAEDGAAPAAAEQAVPATPDSEAEAAPQPMEETAAGSDNPAPGLVAPDTPPPLPSEQPSPVVASAHGVEYGVAAVVAEEATATAEASELSVSASEEIRPESLTGSAPAAAVDAEAAPAAAIGAEAATVAMEREASVIAAEAAPVAVEVQVAGIGAEAAPAAVERKAPVIAAEAAPAPAISTEAAPVAAVRQAPAIGTQAASVAADRATRNVRRSGRPLLAAASAAGVLLVGGGLLLFGRGPEDQKQQAEQHDTPVRAALGTEDAGAGTPDASAGTTGTSALTSTGTGKHRGSAAKNEKQAVTASPSAVPQHRKTPKHAVPRSSAVPVRHTVTSPRHSADPHAHATTVVIQATRTLSAGQSWSATLAHLTMQGDGNLVIYDEQGHARWASNTFGAGNHAVFQADGNLVVYNSANQAVWSSGTEGHNGAELVLQNDGNVVISQDGAALWASGTQH
ncbi:hypothetical protein [Streptomyces gibsoniae]|uniref:Bulb-type lectin domain-containing protein n=1 Tax=Streptomyces gibsoniae TaxID=3075529 RepID=A0ABU2TMK4_9ACTN|nr:hypothetical protein [Streptomyces sp. DSM 41699]MDT0462169.1 hypothetical protein [Streptomyces sp. DSM 41699]